MVQQEQSPASRGKGSELQSVCWPIVPHIWTTDISPMEGGGTNGATAQGIISSHMPPPS